MNLLSRAKTSPTANLFGNDQNNKPEECAEKLDMAEISDWSIIKRVDDKTKKNDFKVPREVEAGRGGKKHDKPPWNDKSQKNKDTIKDDASDAWSHENKNVLVGRCVDKDKSQGIDVKWASEERGFK